MNKEKLSRSMIFRGAPDPVSMACSGKMIKRTMAGKFQKFLRGGRPP
jgi:hypothetical protein